MSQRSVVEFNHDCSFNIKSDKDRFAELLLSALGSGSDRAWAELSGYGLTRVTQCHHSEDRKVVVGMGGLQREYPFG